MRIRRTSSVVTLVTAIVIGLGACSSSGIKVSTGATSKADFCKLVIAFKTANDALGNDVTSGTPVQAKAAMQKIIGQLDTLRKRAPADVKADVDTAAKFIDKFDGLLSKYNYDFKSIEGNAAVANEFQALNNEQVNASLARLGTYGTTECAAAPTTTIRGVDTTIAEITTTTTG